MTLFEEVCIAAAKNKMANDNTSRIKELCEIIEERYIIKSCDTCAGCNPYVRCIGFYSDWKPNKVLSSTNEELKDE